jgi:hypothetical protein
VIEEEYCTLTTPLAVGPAKVSSTLETTSVHTTVAAFGLPASESLTSTLKVRVPVPSGVPVIAPVFGSRVSQAGRPLAAMKWYGGTPPLAATGDE